MIPLPSPMSMAAGGVVALAVAYCVAGVVAMVGVESAAARGCDAPLRTPASGRMRS